MLATRFPFITTFILSLALNLMASPSVAALGQCEAAPGSAGNGSLGGTISNGTNGYWYAAGSNSPSAGSTAVTITSGGTNFARNDLVLVIQMQGAEINSSNNNNYGAGDGTGRGQTANNFFAGKYEFATVSSRTGNTITLKSPLQNSYRTAQGYKWQLIRVPQYQNLTLISNLSAQAWNGSTGGVFVLDVANTLSFNGHAINMSARGFRGGGGYYHAGIRNWSNQDYVRPHATGNSGAHASKGEGIAGTPYWIFNGSNRVATTNTYPNGSYARGAPGNAGGGGTDGNPNANDQNAGGGGGGNGGAGAQGGNSWSSNLPTGGIGGAAFPAAPNRLAMGGGGGAGTVNNNLNGQTHGGVGGGIVIIRANKIEGSGSIHVNGGHGTEPIGSGGDGSNDGSGGGGAGGSVLLLANHQSGNITINARGGNGANNSQNPMLQPGGEHGPGGGGGGGVVFHSNALFPLVDLTQGASGRTGSRNQYYGATPAGGTAGNAISGITPEDLDGTPPGFSCLEKQADLSIEKRRSSGSMQGGKEVSFEVLVTNHGPDNTSAPIVVTDNMDSRLENINAVGENWQCDIIANTVECSYQPALSVNEQAPPLHIEAKVKELAVRSQFSNTASVMFDNSNATIMSSDPNSSNNTSTWKDIIYGVTEAGNKWLYLSELNAQQKTLSRTVPTSNNILSFNNSTVQRFALAPSLASDLTVNGNMTARLCLQKTNNNEMRTAKVELYQNGQRIGQTTTESFANSGWHLYIFPISENAQQTFHAGAPLELRVNRDNNHSFTLSNNANNQDCPGEGPSRLEVDTTTVINVENVSIFGKAHPNINEVFHLTAGETIYVRSLVSDPFGHADINNDSIVEILADGSNQVIAGPFSAQVLNVDGATKTFEYAVDIPNELPQGDYIARVRANEGTEGTISHYGVAPFTITDNANLTVDKSVYDTNETKLNTEDDTIAGVDPGESLIYKLSVSNQSDTGHAYEVTILDKLPPFTELLVGSIEFVDGLSNFNPSGLNTPLVEYSSDHGNSWQYQPQSGAGNASSNHDGALTHIRLRFPEQSMPPNTGFSVTYQVKVR